MTNQEAYATIGQRADEIAKNPAVRAACEKMFNQGESIETIKEMVYKMAIATLCGK